MAGYDQTAEKFGVILSLKHLSSWNPDVEDAYLKRSVNYFLHTAQIKSWESWNEKNYHEIMKKK
jgi:hypothetical protein